jgi:ATP-dependent DNA ligase
VPVSRALSSLACRRLPTGSNWIHEIKHDGFRLMARRDPVGIRLITRGGHDWSARYPLVVEAVNHLKVRSCLIDGEVVCCDEKGVAAFQLLRHRRNEPQACLYAFDLLELDGTDPPQTACPHMTHGQRRFLMHTHGSSIAVSARKKCGNERGCGSRLGATRPSAVVL